MAEQPNQNAPNQKKGGKKGKKPVEAAAPVEEKAPAPLEKSSKNEKNNKNKKLIKKSEVAAEEPLESPAVSVSEDSGKAAAKAKKQKKKEKKAAAKKQQSEEEEASSAPASAQPPAAPAVDKPAKEKANSKGQKENLCKSVSTPDFKENNPKKVDNHFSRCSSILAFPLFLVSHNFWLFLVLVDCVSFTIS